MIRGNGEGEGFAALPVGAGAVLGEYEVLVPVFLKVRLREEDDLAAEVVAEQIVATIAAMEVPWATGTAHVSLHAVIKPSATRI